MKTKQTLALGLIFLSLIGCGPALSQFQAQNRAQAPMRAEDVGVLVNGSSEEDIAKLLRNHPEAKFRTLSAKHGIYEIFHVDAESVQEVIPSATIESNRFLAREKNSRDFRRESILTLQAESSGKSTCLQDPKNEPNPVITVSEPAVDLDQTPLTLGQSFTLDGAQSKANKAAPGQLKMAWVVFAPQGSNLDKKIVPGSTLNYTPDSYGAYHVFLVVQDQRSVCAIASQVVMVTGNKPYLGRGSSVSGLAHVDMSQFTHLPELHAEEAWTYSTGKNVLIAVIDSGVNYNHPMLRNQIYQFPKEIAGNQIDDDGNGFIDDVVGYDFANNDPFPFDDDGHGSHVSGLAAGELMGLAKQAKILPVKAFSPVGGDIGSVVAAIYYAVDSGAQVINMSFGGASAPTQAEIKAHSYAEAKGVLIIAAAGNGDPQTGLGMNNDKTPSFPASLPYSNIVAVAAKDTKDLLAPYSNYGVNSVHVVAPGGMDPDDLIHSSFFENPAGLDYVGMCGTSMASPIVTGIAAQVLSLNPQLTPKQVKEILMTSGTEVPALKNLVASGRYIDALDAVRRAQVRLVLK